MRSRKVSWNSRTLGFLKQEYQGNTEQADNHQHPKLVHIRPERRLLLQRLVYQSVCLIVRSRRTDLRRKCGLQFSNLFVEHRIELAHLTHQKRLMRLRTSCYHCRDRRDPDTAPKVSQKICQSCSLTSVLARHSRHRIRCHWNEDTGRPKTADDDRPDYIARSDLKREITKHVHRQR